MMQKISKDQRNKILNNFQCHVTDITETFPFYKEVQKIQKTYSANFKYATSITFKSEQLILLSLSTADNLYSTNQFNYYIKLMPSLSLDDVSLLLALSTTEKGSMNNLFEWPQTYPSAIALELLQETNGQLIYTYQLHQLLSVCKPCIEINYQLIDYFRKVINKRDETILNELKMWCLPDGISIYHLLVNYAPLKDNTAEIGFLNKPMHFEALRFIDYASR